jgi:hypothetical protein
MLKKRFAAIVAVVLCFSLAFALSAQEAMNNEGIIKLVKSNMSEDLILSIIRQQPGTYSLGATDLVALKEAGISERIIAAMLAKSKPDVAAGVSVDPASKQAPQAATRYPSIAKPGVYYKKGNEYFELITEDITWKTTGALKNIVSAGIVKKDLNGTLSGPSSRNFLTSPVEIVINLPTGLTVNSYVLLPLKAANSQRDFLVGPVNKKSGVAKGSIACGMEKVGDNLYRMVFQPALPPGEYGILEVFPSDAATTASKMYTFRILL